MTEARCMYCGCVIAPRILEAAGKDGLLSEFCEDCIEKHYQEITGNNDEGRSE